MVSNDDELIEIKRSHKRAILSFLVIYGVFVVVYYFDRKIDIY